MVWGIKLSKLTIKILTIFTALIISVAVIMLISINLFTTRQFKRFIQDSDVLISRDYSVLLSQYYELHGNSWDNVDMFVHSFQTESKNRMNWIMSGSMDNMEIMNHETSTIFDESQRIVVLNTEGEIIADTLDLIKGEKHPVDHWNKGMSISLNGKIIGSILYGSMITPVLNPMNRDFLKSVNWAIFTSSLIVVIIALSVGYFFVSSLLDPLKKLGLGIQKIADGESDIRVVVKGEDEIKKLAENFNKMSERLSHAKRIRNQLTADISHEIRTPITTIQGELEAVIDGLYPLDIETVKNIYQDTIILSGIVEDLQFIDSLEYGRHELKLQKTNILDILENAFTSFKLLSKDSGIELKKDFDNSIPYMELDTRRIRQVINNLISNAIRYSSRGSEIVIGAHLSMEKELIVFVSDRGIGIAEQDISNIFERFYRADSSRARSSGGSGLGLSISKSIIEAHGGRIEVQSILGKGTTMSCIFDLRA